MYTRPPSETGFPTNAFHLLVGAACSTGCFGSISIEERAIADFFRLFTKSRAQDSKLCRFIVSRLDTKNERDSDPVSSLDEAES